jgi:putative FmdB family regulatory protein
MPTYEYQCTRCGTSVEKFQQMRDEPLTTCSACGGELRRLIGAGAGVIVRGAAGPACRGGGREDGCCGREAGTCGCDPERCHG